jgi:hypothetical protein
MLCFLIIVVTCPLFAYLFATVFSKKSFALTDAAGTSESNAAAFIPVAIMVSRDFLFN